MCVCVSHWGILRDRLEGDISGQLPPGSCSVDTAQGKKCFGNEWGTNWTWPVRTLIVVRIKGFCCVLLYLPGVVLTWVSRLSWANFSFSCSHSLCSLPFSSSSCSFSFCRRLMVWTSSSFSLWASSIFCCRDKEKALRCVYSCRCACVCVCIVAEPGSLSLTYLQVSGPGGHHQDVRVALILHSQQLVLWGALSPEQEGRAGPSDLPLVGHIAELVELPIIVGYVVSWGRNTTTNIKQSRARGSFWTGPKYLWSYQVAGSLAVKTVGPVTEKLLVRIPETTRWKSVAMPLSKALNSNCSCKSLLIRANAKM